MIQLLYVSRAAPGITTADVKAILEEAIVFNAAHDVTGLLVFDGGWFMQALEGPAAAVDALFGRIQKDRRNRDVGLISRAEVDARAFGNWAMAWNPVAPAGEPLDDIVAALAGNIEDAELRDAFLRFAGLTRAVDSFSSPSQTLQ